MTMTTVTPAHMTNGHPAEQVEIVDVTPELAALWLEKNTHNRNLRERQAHLYAADMSTGDWRWTGESIKFAYDGTLLDGQHRLRAVVIAGVTVRMLVIRGLAPEAQEDVDGGVPRKFYDVLSLRGEADAASLGSIVRRVHFWEAGARKHLAGTATTAQLLRTLDAHPELRGITRRARQVAGHCDLPASVVGVAMWLFDHIDDADSEFFFTRLADGQGLVKGDPIYELRRTIDNTKDVRGHRSQTYLLAIVIKAWNAYRNGDTVSLYRWRPGGAKPEQFPEPA